MNSRRRFLKKLSWGALFGAGTLASCTKKGGSSASVHTGQSYKWKMVTAWPKNFPAMGTGANYLAKSIEAMSGGRIQIRVYGAGELVPALGVFDAVSRGTAELGHSAAYYWKGKAEAAQFFAAVPFGLTADEVNGWVLHGGGQALWDELYSDFNLKPFLAGSTGVQMGGWFKKELKGLSDFKGLKMRIPGLGGEVLRTLGTTVVTLPGGEVFQSLRSGAIDATEWIGPYNDLAFGLHKAAKYYYWPGWQEPGSALECMVNKNAYEGLPSDLQAVIREACQSAYGRILAEFSARNGDALDTLINKHKIQLRKFPDPVMKKLESTSREVVFQISQKNSLSKRIYGSFNQFRKKSIGWSKISELGYGNARAMYS